MRNSREKGARMWDQDAPPPDPISSLTWALYWLISLQHEGDPEWTKCTLTCGGGMQTNVDNSSIVRTCNTMSCPGNYA